MQLAFVVRDLDNALRYWTETLRVGPFVVIERAIEGRTVVHRGQRTEMELTLAFSYVGDMQIELVRATSDAPSPYREYLDSGREGLHHVAYWPENFEGACAHLEASGLSEVCVVYAPDSTRAVVHYDAPSHIGTMVELVPASSERWAYFARMRRLVSGWDGSRPVRRYETRDVFLASGEGAEGKKLGVIRKEAGQA
jgi:catechol 2,3-dioxygenase-like lactoylglutathione lyase family enzyme